MPPQRVTRGHGLIEPMLARMRASRANALIRPEQRQGRLLDVGCGSFPHFLATTEFAEKFGLDRVVTPDGAEDLSHKAQLAPYDVHEADRLPFEDGFFDVVTMLAVFEHIRVERLAPLITDIHRVLKPGGSYILTTPSGWTGPILHGLKLVGMVSRQEIDEHEDSYSGAMIRGIMAQTPFAKGDVELGYFELGMNIWMRATKR